MASTIKVKIPENIQNEVQVSEIYQNLTQSGNSSSWGVDLELSELNLRKQIKSRELATLHSKIEDMLAAWSDKFAKHRERKYKENREEEAKRLNDELEALFERLANILTDTLDVDDSVNWDRLKSRDQFTINPDDLFPENRKPDYLVFKKSGEPQTYEVQSYPDQPTRKQAKREVGFLRRVFRPKTVDEHLEDLHRWYEQRIAEIDQENAERQEMFNTVQETFAQNKAAFEHQQRERNQAIDDLRERFKQGNPAAVEEHIDIVFQNSTYPDEIPRNWDREFRPDAGMLIVNLQLPAPEDLPAVESYSYVKSRDEIKAKSLSEPNKAKLYDDVIYKMILRTLHEIFESDVPGVIEAATVNGYIDTINKATGQREFKTIASISASKEAFEKVNLINIEPKETFKHFKGVSAAKLSDLAPVPPVLEMSREDKRFIEGKDVASELHEGRNVAAMEWQDFEYLIRELFHAEFARTGGEVKVTQASSDGGVDAVAYDPDPLRGGKIVIQAKRYTNTVGLSAVRDLYGTVMNEGASSGILVTTSEYGKEAYEFAKDKPIKLLNGSNLLSLLEQHGHKARIDLSEAKKSVK